MLVSDMSSEAEVEKELVISISISVASGSLTSSVHDVDSTYSGMLLILVEVVCGSADLCLGLSEATSSEATSEAFKVCKLPLSLIVLKVRFVSSP